MLEIYDYDTDTEPAMATGTSAPAARCDSQFAYCDGVSELSWAGREDEDSVLTTSRSECVLFGQVRRRPRAML